MRVLEARFHPTERHGPDFILVGRVMCTDGGEIRVEAAPELHQHTAPATMLATLRHLVRMTQPNPFEGLQALRNRFWSFVTSPQDLPELTTNTPRSPSG